MTILCISPTPSSSLEARQVGLAGLTVSSAIVDTSARPGASCVAMSTTETTGPEGPERGPEPGPIRYSVRWRLRAWASASERSESVSKRGRWLPSRTAEPTGYICNRDRNQDRIER